MDEYGEKIKDLFEEQGFEIKERVFDSSIFLEAEREGHRMIIGFESSQEIGKIREMIEKTSDITNQYKKLFFSTLKNNDQRNKVEEFAENKNVEVSFFRLIEEEEKETPEFVPSSYEIIGDVAVVNIEEGVEDKKEDIAEHIVKQNPNVKTVLEKTKELSGEFRVGGYRKILGERTETVHIEHGARFKLDPTKVFFSERLSHERQRIVEKVEDGEVVHAWFAGVGPYPVLVARNKNPGKVYAVEKNPDACGYLRENVKLNKVEDRVEVFCGDVEQIVSELEKPDRIIMPLPKGSKNFLDLAFECVKKGGTIHYYRFASEEDMWDKIIDEIREVADKRGESFEVKEKEVCGHYAPYVHRVCVDFKVL